MVGAAIESGVDGAAAAENAATSIGDTVLRGEGLRRGVDVGGVCVGAQEIAQEPFLVHQVGLSLPNASTFEEKHSEPLRQRRRQRTPRRAATDNDVVVVIFRWKLARVRHHLQVTRLCVPCINQCS